MMKAANRRYTIESMDHPMCPNCSTDLPIPGLEMFSYQCPACGGHYRLNLETVRVYKTERWLK